MSVVSINAVPIWNVTMDEALDAIDDTVKERRKRSVFFVNADCINISARDPEYHRVLGRDGAMVFGDGAGIRLAGRVSGQPVKDNVNGTDMFPLLCERAAAKGHRLFLLGAQPGVADEVVEKMARPGLEFAGTHHGYFDDPGPVIEAINRSKADIVLVAFGAPRQERWIDAHHHEIDAPVMMGVGGLFDFYSGRIRRAPRILRDHSLEWSWRLLMEPRRMWKRYLIGNFTFVGRVVWWELSGRNR